MLGRFDRLLGMRNVNHALSAVSLLALLATYAAGQATSTAQVDPGTATTSFESCRPGALGETPVGTLTAQEGRAEVVGSHARTGSQSLRLFGGQASAVELLLAVPAESPLELGFWAERWTARGPFQFTVEAFVGDWTLVHDGTDALRVGARFLSEVRATVPTGATRLRFRCVSPPDTGVLIDDLELVSPSPMRLQATRAEYPVLPILVGNLWNPVARLDLEVAGTEGALELTEVTVAIDAASQSLVSRVALFRGPAALDYRDPRAVLVDEQRFGGASSVENDAISFEGRAVLGRGTTSFWVAVELAEEVSLEQSVTVSIQAARVSGVQHIPDGADDVTSQRLGVALRNPGDDGSRAFRIPGLVTTSEGTLIAVYDVRWKGWGDLPGDIDVGMMRSTDRGDTWEPQRIVMDMGGDGGPESRGDGVGDPAILVDRQTNTIHVIATWSHGNRAWNGSGPGTAPEETGQLMLVSSRDDGVTWSEPRNLTEDVKPPEWSYLLQGPGRGITAHDGTLVFPAQYQLSPAEGRMPHSTVLLSRDRGVTWTVGAGAKTNTTEAAVVETVDGVYMLNMRDNRGGSRSVYTSEDPLAGWTEHSTSRHALREPVCMASLIHVGREIDGKADGRLIFSNPDVERGPRRRMSLQSSVDHGATWLPATVLLDDGASAGYSCLTMIDAKTVGILYEGSRAHMTFQRIPLTELFR